MKQTKPNQFIFEAIGTKWVIDLFGSPSFASLQKLIDSFDKEYSRFRKDSKIQEMSTSVGDYKLSDPEMVDFYKSLYEKTNGLVTPLVGSLMEEAGYDSTYSLKPKTLHQPLKWEDALIWNSPILTLKEPVLLDFGAAGKGRLIDLVGRNLIDQNIESFSIDAGGDILLSKFPSKIGLEHPLNTSQVIGVVEISNGSICGSSGNRRKWKNHHHIFNPKELKSVDNVLSTWVIAKTAMEADGLATALFFVPPESLTGFDFEFLILYPDYTFRKSNNFPGELYESHR